MARALVVKITAGADDPERTITALNVASAAAVSGVAVSLWLSGDATWLATKTGQPELIIAGAPDWQELYDTATSISGAKVCAQCAQRRGIRSEDLRDGATIAGVASFVAEVTEPGVQALVY
ncbi:MAG: DsrE family protein [Actinomycetia bacterium]|nr:DsrE family protein [Actinomycetes bacterium]